MPSYGDCQTAEIDAPPQACFDAMLARAMARDREDRYASMKEMAAALETVRAGVLRRIFRR